jgi:hypothetical protein
MFWFWLNIPLAAAFFGAWYGIPMWKVLNHPDWGSEPAAGHSGQFAAPQAVVAVDRGDHPVGATPVGAGAGRHA